MDIRTLAIVLSLTNFLQAIALFAQYRLNRPREGLGWWAMGNAAVALGFAFNALRDSPALGQFAIVANDVLFLAGLALLYVGVLRFLDKPRHGRWLVALCAAIALIAIYFTLVNDALGPRRFTLSAGLAALSFLIGRVLLLQRRAMGTGLASSLAAVFLANGAFFALRALTPLAPPEIGALSIDSTTQMATYLVVLVTSTLWTFGFIALINRRLNVENREARENLELVFNTNPDAVLITRLHDGYLVRINDGFTTLTGFTRDDVIGKSTLQLDIWNDAADRVRMIAALNEKGTCDNIQALIRRKDGTVFKGALSARLLPFQGVPHIISVSRDITERERTEQALRESEERYRDLVENANDIIYSLDLAGNFTSANRAAERLTGYTRDEILNLNLGQVVTPDNFTHLRQMLQAKISDGELDTTYPMDIRAKDGRTISLELSTRLKYQDGVLVGSQGIARDITERKRLEEELKQQATTDDLTGIWNRRQFLRLAQRELKRAVRLKHPVALVLADIDRLKDVNDKYGHAGGDRTIVAFTLTCKEHIRETDVFARLGGDEFALLLPEASREHASQAVERVRAALAATPIEMNGSSFSVTISAGIVSLANESESLDSLMARGDHLLYKAKGEGRNRVEVEPD